MDGATFLEWLFSDHNNRTGREIRDCTERLATGQVLAGTANLRVRASPANRNRVNLNPANLSRVDLNPAKPSQVDLTPANLSQ